MATTQDLTGNSFIANVNFLVRNFNSIIEIWGKAEEISKNVTITEAHVQAIADALNKARNEADRAVTGADSSTQRAAEAESEANRAKSEADRASSLNIQNIADISNQTQEALADIQDAVIVGRGEIEQLCTLLHLESGVYNTRAAFSYTQNLSAGDEIQLPIFYYPKRNTLLLAYKGVICTPSNVGIDDTYSYSEIGDDPNVPSDKITINFNVEQGEHFDAWVVTSAYGKNLDILEAIRQEAQDLLESAKERVGDFISGGFVQDVAYDKQTGDLTFTWKDNTTLTINVIADTLLQGLNYDQTTSQLVLTKTDGSELRVDISELIDVYTGVENDHIQLTVNSTNEIEATLKKDSITVDEMVPELRESLEEIANKVEWLTENTTEISNEADGWFESPPVMTGDIITLPVSYYPTRNALILFYHGLQCTPRKDNTLPAGLYQYEEVGTDPDVLSNQVRVFFDIEDGDDLYAWVASSIVTVRGKPIEYFFKEVNHRIDIEINNVLTSIKNYFDDLSVKIVNNRTEFLYLIRELKESISNDFSYVYNKIAQEKQFLLDKIAQEVTALNTRIDIFKVWVEEQIELLKARVPDYANPSQYTSPILKGDTILLAPYNGIITGMIGPAGGGGGLYQVAINGTVILKSVNAPGNQTIPIYAQVAKDDIIVITASASGSGATFYQFIPIKEII